MNGAVGRQRNRAINRIARMIEAASPEKRRKMLDQMIDQIQIEYIESGKRKLGKEAFAQLSARLGEHALAWGNVRYLTDYFALRVSDPSDPKFWARNVLSAGFYRYIGSDVEHALRFCRLIFRATATFLAQADQSVMAGNDPKQTKASYDAVSFSVLLLNAAGVATDSAAPQKLWLLCLIEAAMRGHREADEFVRSVVEGVELTAALSGNDLQLISDEELEASAPADPMKHMEHLFVTWPDQPRIVLPEKHLTYIRNMRDRYFEKADRDLRESQAFANWFVASYDRLAAHYEGCRQEIEEHPRYGIRPFGYDSVRVRVSVLNMIGITGFAFHTEGECFPDVKLEVYVKKTAVGLCNLYAFFRKGELQCTDQMLDNWQGFDLDFLRSVLEFIVMDAMFRIVCKEASADEAGEKVTRSAAKRPVAQKQHQIVRPFLRRLPVGWQASDEARKRAFLHFGWSLPDGVTFVQSHERWVDLPAEKPAPVFTYTDKTIKQSIEED